MAKTSFFSGTGTNVTEVDAIDSIKTEAQTAATNAATSATAAASSATSAASSATSAASSASSAAASASSINTVVATQSTNGLMSAADKTKLDGVESGAAADQTASEIKTAYESNSDTNAFTDALQTKLNGIETSADVTDATNVQAAGALMDSEVTSLSGIKTLTVPDNTTVSTFGASLVDDADAAAARTTLGLGTAATTASTAYATAAQGTTADAALPKAGGTMTGNIVMSGAQTVDGRDLSVDGAKLDNIEANATADQTASEIEAIVNHDNLQGFVANEHIDWTASGAGTIHATNIPVVALTTVQTAANQTAHLALTAQEGDIVVRSDENKSYVHNGGTAGTMADYTELLTPTDAVLSVNGQTGAVVISNATTSSDGLMSSTDKTKLDGIEANADVTDATNVAAAGAAMTSGATFTGTVVAGDLQFLNSTISDVGDIYLDAGDDIHLDAAGGTIYLKDAGTSFAAFQETTSPYTFDIRSFGLDRDIRIQGNDGGTTITALTLDMSEAGAATFNAGATFNGDITVTGTVDGRDVATDGTKLDGIATNANNYTHPNHTGDVTSVADGATTIVDDAVTYAKIQNIVGNNVLLGNDDGAGSAVQELTAANVRSIINVEDGATADQTGAEIKTAYEGEADTNAFTDALLTKLNGIETNADVTDTANVTAAGALMDSELTSEASVKAIDQGLATTDTPTFAGLTANGNIVFEGATADDFETTVTVTDPTADQTITLPDQTGTVMLWQSEQPDNGTYNYAIGSGALSSGSLSGIRNIAIGANASDSVTTGSNNISIGVNSSDTTTGSNNVHVGYSGGPDALQANNNYQVSIGPSAYAVGDYSISIGSGAGGTHFFNKSDSTECVFIGRNAGYDANGANYNTAVGSLAAANSNFTGDYNSAFGRASLGDATSASYNCCFGVLTGGSLTTGTGNTAIGYTTMYATTTGSNHTFVGSNAGYGTVSTNDYTGSNLTGIGYRALPSSTTASDEITLGDTNVATLRCNVTTISSLSDQRDKKDIEDISYGLGFINSMRPVQFTWDRRDKTRKGVTDIGFIAQELADVEYEYSSGSRTRLVQVYSDKFEADPLRTYPILVKAVQEMSAKIQQLETRISQLEGN